MLLVPLVTAALGAVSAPRAVKESIAIGGLAVTWLLCLATASQFLNGAIPTAFDEALRVDGLSALMLVLCGLAGLLSAAYSVGYLRRNEIHGRVTPRKRLEFAILTPVYVFAMLLVVVSNNLGILWIAVELTTLTSVFLVAFHDHDTALEAAWKFLMLGSLGLGFALLGTVLLFASAHGRLGEELPALNWTRFMEIAPTLHPFTLRLGVVFTLIGYGTKAGLAPMHTWKPDAYGEAPGVVGAVLAGGVTSCAFLAVLRIYQICQASGDSAYTSRLLLFMGLFSMAVAGLFMVGQRDFKRMLAYSSVEHMGILAMGLGIGGPALFGTMLHVVTNGLTKGVLFLSAGNIHRAYASKSTDQVRGAMRRVPLSGALFLVGFLAITGSPPFGPFISLFAILNGAIDAERFVTAGLFLFLLLVVFIGMGATVLQVVQGRQPAEVRDRRYRDGLLTAAPVVGLMSLVLLLGVSIPAPLGALLNDAVRFLESRP
jgi:hydrogenase-4 component F